MVRTIFLTGATGFVGSNLTCELLKQGYKLKLLIRDQKISADERLEKSLSYLFDTPEEYKSARNKIEIINGDITCSNLGIAPAVLKELSSEIDLVFHNAALITFDESSRESLERQNIIGTKNVLDFTLKLKQPNFHYVSTAYVCGQEDSAFREDDLDIGQKFNNPYEETKFKAERLIHEYKEKFNIKVNIYRPSIIVGDSKTGKALNFMGVYSYIKAVYFMVELFREDIKKEGKRASIAGVSYKGDVLNIPLRIPGDINKTLNIIPIDYFTKAVTLNLKTTADSGNTYHIVNSAPPTLGELNNAICSIFNISGIRIVDKDVFSSMPMTEWEKFFIGSIHEVTPYLQRKEPVFYDSNTRKMLMNAEISCPQIIKELVAKLTSYYIKSIKVKR